MFFTMVQSNSPSRRQKQHEAIHLLKSGMQDSLRGHADIIFYAWQGTDLNMSLPVRTNLCSDRSKIATISCIFFLFENTRWASYCVSNGKVSKQLPDPCHCDTDGKALQTGTLLCASSNTCGFRWTWVFSRMCLHAAFMCCVCLASIERVFV